MQGVLHTEAPISFAADVSPWEVVAADEAGKVMKLTILMGQQHIPELT